MNRREFGMAAFGAAAAAGAPAPAGITRYVRFQRGGKTAYGILETDVIREIRGDLFGSHQVTRTRHKPGEVKLLYPCEPTKVLAIGFNYALEIGKRKPPDRPEMFFKAVSALQNPGDPIKWPKGATRVAYEAEMVVVIGKRAKGLDAEGAAAAIFGATCGNDVSEREWQEGKNHDLQWWRGKACDTFAPFGPVLVRGLDYRNLKLEGRLNGKVVQSANTSQMIYDPVAQVSFVSQYMTLMPGDIIYTGTPGATGMLKPGDVFEVEIEGIGVLRNPVEA